MFSNTRHSSNAAFTISSKHAFVAVATLDDAEEEDEDAAKLGGRGRSLLLRLLVVDDDDDEEDEEDLGDNNAFSRVMMPSAVTVDAFIPPGEADDDDVDFVQHGCLCRIQRPAIVMAATVLLDDENNVSGFLMIVWIVFVLAQDREMSIENL